MKGRSPAQPSPGVRSARREHGCFTVPRTVPHHEGAENMLTSHRFRAVLKAMIAIAVLAALGTDDIRLAIAGKPSGGTTPAYTLTNLGCFTAYGTFLDTQARGITNPDAFGVVHVA